MNKEYHWRKSLVDSQGSWEGLKYYQGGTGYAVSSGQVLELLFLTDLPEGYTISAFQPRDCRTFNILHTCLSRADGNHGAAFLLHPMTPNIYFFLLALSLRTN
jgi:hypothetical protein